jgi:hypothetical protein
MLYESLGYEKVDPHRAANQQLQQEARRTFLMHTNLVY